MKRVIVRSAGKNGYMIEVLMLVAGKERVDQRSLCSDLVVARKIAARISTMNGGCPIEDRTVSDGGAV